jgi:hypothetical protein
MDRVLKNKFDSQQITSGGDIQDVSHLLSE